MKIGSTCPDRMGIATAREKIDSRTPTPTECSHDNGLAFVPDGAHIVESLKWTVMILDGIVDRTVSTQRVNLVLVPAAQVVGIAQYEPVG